MTNECCHAVLLDVIGLCIKTDSITSDGYLAALITPWYVAWQSIFATCGVTKRVRIENKVKEKLSLKCFFKNRLNNKNMFLDFETSIN